MSRINTLGPVGFNPRGFYNASTTYERLDVVTYQNSSYLALKSSVGQEPPNDEYWQILVNGTLWIYYDEFSKNLTVAISGNGRIDYDGTTKDLIITSV